MRTLALSMACACVTLPLAAPLRANPPKLATIPFPFQGVWDVDLKACESAASDMRIYIGSDRMRLGDAVGNVRLVTRAEERSVTAFTSFLSEGDRSDEEVRLTLSPDGEKLTLLTGQNSTARYRCPLRS